MKILCFGDSNTYGYDPRGFGGRYGNEDRWVDRLEMQTGYTAINAGVNGLEIPRHVLQLQEAVCLLVMLGTNVLLQGATAKEAVARMGCFLTSLLPHYQQTFLIAPPPMKRGAWVPTDDLVSVSFQLGEEYRLLAEKLNVTFIDARNWNIELAFDGVHFTVAGHHIFAEKISKELLAYCEGAL